MQEIETHRFVGTCAGVCSNTAVGHSGQIKCSIIQPFCLKSRTLCTKGHPDLFALLGVERSFALDSAQLHSAYKRVMSEFHPDRLGHKSASDQADAASHTAAVTHAYTVISRPHLRAKHLLELRGRPLDEDEGGDLLGAEFLMEVMESREAIESATSAQMSKLREVNARRMAEVSAALRAAFDEAQLDDARRLTAQLQYLHKIESEINERTTVE
eukprot:6202620-Pleurochrysis_carterae.AAC.2